MSIFTRWSFRNKAAVSILTILVLGLGILSYTTLPMEFFPAADQPQVSVVATRMGPILMTAIATLLLPFLHRRIFFKQNKQCW
jgi:multidrug efflux pump subunit AcrB